MSNSTQAVSLAEKEGTRKSQKDSRELQDSRRNRHTCAGRPPTGNHAHKQL